MTGEAGRGLPEPVEEGLADRLTRQAEPKPSSVRVASFLRRLGGYDRALYERVAGLSTPLLDEPLRRVSHFADFSKPWLLVAGGLALVGGRQGRRAALTGLAAVGAASFVVNQPMKRAGERLRPDRDGLGVPAQRWVRMPSSTSFPSGHSASAAAFAVAVGEVVPALRLPLRAAASVVAFSRVYTGVHYPSDVLVGATVGALLGRVPRELRLRLGSESGAAGRRPGAPLRPTRPGA
jgi:membrane-associated phospholipid phosphatase